MWKIKYLVVLALIFSVSPCFAVWDAVDSDFTKDISFRNAIEQVSWLKNSLIIFKQRLAEMDEASKDNHGWELDDQYKEVRSEMVKVIQDINASTQKMTTTIQTLYRFREELQKNVKVLEETKYHLEVAKKYLNQLLFMVYKMEREIYNETWDEVDLLKTFVKSDVMPQLLAWDDTLRILLNQINSLLQKTSAQEQQKTDTVKRLTELKVSAQKSLDYYKTEMQKLDQKRADLCIRLFFCIVNILIYSLKNR